MNHIIIKAIILSAMLAPGAHAAEADTRTPGEIEYGKAGSRYSAAVAAAKDQALLRQITAEHADWLYRFAGENDNEVGTRAMIEASVFLWMSGDRERSDDAFGKSIERTMRNGSWDNKMLLLQAAGDMEDKQMVTRQLVRSHMREGRADAAKAKQLGAIAQRLGFEQEAAILNDMKSPAAAGAGTSARPAAAANKGYDTSKSTRPRNSVGGFPIDFTAMVHQTGEKLTLSGLQGQVVLLDFWATWCGPCIRELPMVKKTYADFHDKGFEIVGVSLDQDLTKFGNFLRANQMPWPQIADGQGWQAALAQRFGVRSIPATYLIGPDGLIAATNLRGGALYQSVSALLGGAQ